MEKISRAPLFITDNSHHSSRWQLNRLANAGIDAHDKLGTLFHFVAAINGEEGYSSPLANFTGCPTTRANLLSDIQQLEAFILSRKCELSSKSTSALSGRDAIELEWIQYSQSQSSSPLGNISLEDVNRYHTAI